MGRRLTPKGLLALTLCAAPVLLTGCDTVEQFIGVGDQVLTVAPSGGASFEGRCIPRGEEPVTISGSKTRTWTFEDGVACRIVQKGSGKLSVEITGPRGTATATTDRDGQTASVSRG